MINFGPATIIHHGVDIGKTLGGVVLNIKFHENEVADASYDIEQTAYLVEGILRRTELSKTISGSSDVNLYGYAEMQFITAYGTIKVYYAKLVFPKTINFGQLTQGRFDCRIIGKPHPSTNLLIGIE